MDIENSMVVGAQDEYEREGEPVDVEAVLKQLIKNPERDATIYCNAFEDVMYFCTLMLRENEEVGESRFHDIEDLGVKKFAVISKLFCEKMRDSMKQQIEDRDSE